MTLESLKHETYFKPPAAIAAIFIKAKNCCFNQKQFVYLLLFIAAINGVY